MMKYLILGDCAEKMRDLADNSIDAIVTDPPYGLSDDSGNSIDKIFTKVVFPETANFYAKRFCNGELPFPSDSVSLLDFVNGSIWKDSWVAMEKCSIHFNSNHFVRQKEIKTTSISSIRISYGELMDEFYSMRGEPITDFILQPRNLFETSISDCFRSCFREDGLGVVSVPIVIPSNSYVMSSLRTLSQSDSALFRDIVRSNNCPPRQVFGSSNVMTSCRTENRVVLRFDTRRGTIELLPADSTFAFNSFCEMIPLPPNIGTFTTTSCLPPKYQAAAFRFVGDATNRTYSFYFHANIIAYLRKNRKGFMGANWDYGVPGEMLWREALRVAKPGAHLLAFGGTRTYHRLACAIEDAGWECRDSIMWHYSTGFPKSMDVAKAIDKASGYKGEVIGTRVVDVGMQGGNMHAGRKQQQQQQQIRALSPEAAKWNGWGTALKPATEIIMVARKPLEGTVAANVLKYGTGAINIDACRVPTFSDGPGSTPKSSVCGRRNSMAGSMDRVEYDNTKGRFPANLVHDGSNEVLALFPDNVKGGTWNRTDGARPFNNDGKPTGYSSSGSDISIGSAARFFYCAKASRKERGDFNDHMTVKPLALMRYLVRFVTRKGGIVLDPFMGSGTTGVAAIQEGAHFIGIERDPHYYEIAQKRIEQAEPETSQMELPL